MEYGSGISIKVQTEQDLSDHPWYFMMSDDGHGKPCAVFLPQVEPDTWKWLMSMSVSDTDLGARWDELMRQANEL